MTATGEQIAYSDAYARTAEARVAAVEAGDTTTVVLDRTVFYPGGGGQPSDRGLIIRAADGRLWTVRGAHKAGGEIVHELEPDGSDPPAVGDLVQVDLEWARRFALMRTHTALHALCGVVWRDYGAQVTGGNMEPGSGRMDFEFERMSVTSSTPSNRPSMPSWRPPGADPRRSPGATRTDGRTTSGRARHQRTCTSPMPPHGR